MGITNCFSEGKSKTFHNTNEAAVKKVILVCGGPNVGKTTHCKHLVEDFGFGLISYQKFLKDSQKREPHSQISEEPIKTLDSQFFKMLNEQKEQVILIDDFPKSIEDIKLWEKPFQLSINVNKILYLFCSEEEMKYRGAKTKGIDLETMNTCVNGYFNASFNFLDELANHSMFTSISTMESIDNVYSQICGELKLNKVINMA